ncbi:MAG: hypothetical protein KUG76_05265 [Gammaproteobacteria bacterium]|nr:hypothetical protein [Gammaproteobacteria bacterium]
MRIKNLVAVMMLLASQALWADEQVVNKYAVVSGSISQESPMFKQHIQEQAAALMNLWREGVVENVYLNHEVNRPENKRNANIVFFIKAKNKDEANGILKQLPFVQHDVLNFTLYPVGVLWLKEIEDDPELTKE